MAVNIMLFIVSMYRDEASRSRRLSDEMNNECRLTNGGKGKSRSVLEMLRRSHRTLWGTKFRALKFGRLRSED